MPGPRPIFEIRLATASDIPVLPHHRAAMFRDMGSLAWGSEAPLIAATTNYLREALPHGEYLGWVAVNSVPSPHIIGGVGVQLRPLVPRPGSGDGGLELGPEAVVLSMYVEPPWRRRGVGEKLMRSLLEALAERGLGRIVLHASDDGRHLYERLGFVPTNEMRLGMRPR